MFHISLVNRFTHQGFLILKTNTTNIREIYQECVKEFSNSQIFVECIYIKQRK